MKARLSSVVLLPVCVIMSVAGCSVKEDRDRCPCRLLVDFSAVGSGVPHVVDLCVTSADGFLFNDVVDIDGLDGIYAVDVPKGTVRVNVYAGDEGCGADDGSLIIPEGSQCPPVFMFSGEVDAGGEQASCQPVLRKSHCVVGIRLVRDDGELPFSLRIIGSVAGYGVDGLPYQGEFSHVLEIDSSGRGSVCVPRQTDGSLVLEIVEDGDVLRRFALGEMILASGYDWNAPDLADVDIEFDYSKTDVTFAVDDWEAEFSFDITI